MRYGIGGKDRFWIGPEGGQFSIFFKKGDPFDLNKPPHSGTQYPFPNWDAGGLDIDIAIMYLLCRYFSVKS